MNVMLEHAETLFRYLVEWGILILEFFGTCVLLVTAIISMVKWLKKSPDVRTTISQGILLALAFKMGGEVLRTVIATETTELVSIFAIILLRAKIEAMYHNGLLPEKPSHKRKSSEEKETVEQV